MNFKIEIDDTTDDEDTFINGTVHFELPDEARLCDFQVAWCVQEILTRLTMQYYKCLTDFNISIEIIDVNFKDGWLDYSIEGTEEKQACAFWKNISY